MSACDQYGVRILRYLEGHLADLELAEFRAHLRRCSTCRVSVETERLLSQLLHRSRPLYSAPPGLRGRVARLWKSRVHPHVHTQVSTSV
jgi:anti-sigma factor RsiW